MKIKLNSYIISSSTVDDNRQLIENEDVEHFGRLPKNVRSLVAETLDINEDKIIIDSVKHVTTFYEVTENDIITNGVKLEEKIIEEN